MSRICGIHGPEKAAGRALAGGMLFFLRAACDWPIKILPNQHAALGWTGRGQENAARKDGLSAVVDGHIYNSHELGQSGSDAELLLSLYEHFGFEGALTRINGDFAAALFDENEGLWLGRDRFGLKPLYYCLKNGWLAFASRPGALLRLPFISREVNREFVALYAASHYRYFDNRPEKSPYADIAQLPAAHCLRFKNNAVSTARYWDLDELPDHAPVPELAERYRELLFDAVRLRLNRAPKPAFTLSGGLDSSSVLASSVRLTGNKQSAVSTVYEDDTYDESKDIQPMLEACVAQWRPVTIGQPDVLGLIASMQAVHDEPVATATWLSHFLLCREAAGLGFQSLFGGLGGDELNAGEYEYFFFHFADLRQAGLEAELSQEIKCWIQYHDHPIFRKSPELVEDMLARVVDLSRPGRCLPDRNRLTRYFRALDPDYFDLSGFEPVMDHPFSSYLKNRTCQDIFRETTPCCLRAEDRQTSAFDLDNFLPFFDHRLVEFMFRIPGGLKIKNGLTKYLLRQAMAGVLPEETRTRIKKTGWNAPAHVWFSGKGLSPVLDLVHSRQFKEHGVYNLAEVLRIIREHEEIVSTGAHRENHMMFLWQLVNLELWLTSLSRAEEQDHLSVNGSQPERDLSGD